MTNPKPSTARQPGRPREFDLDEALDRAIIVFSERGYHAASIAELAAAMELTPGSLYKAFPDKRAIFLAAFDRYKQVRDGLLEAELAQERTGRDRVRRVLQFYAEASHGEMGRRGCLVVGSATEVAIFDTEMAARVERAVGRNEARLQRFIREGQEDGSIPTSLDAAVMAHLTLCITHGLRINGKTGRKRETTLAVVDAAMKLFD